MTRNAKFEALEVKRSALDPDAGYTRRQPIIEVEFTCEICGKTQTVEQLPGATPKYCPDGECKREANRRRVADFRARKRAEGQTKGPSKARVTEPTSNITPVSPVAAKAPAPARKQRPDKGQALPPLTSADLPGFDKPLTDKARVALFAFCEAEYKRRHGRDWRFKGGKITRSKGNKFLLWYPAQSEYSIDNYVTCLTRGWLDITLLNIVNDAGDLKMTFR